MALCVRNAEFYSVINDIIDLGQSERSVLLASNALVPMIDFYSTNHSAYVVQNEKLISTPVAPPVQLAQAICKLVRSCGLHAHDATSTAAVEAAATMIHPSPAKPSHSSAVAERASSSPIPPSLGGLSPAALSRIERSLSNITQDDFNQCSPHAIGGGKLRLPQASLDKVTALMLERVFALTLSFRPCRTRFCESSSQIRLTSR